MQLNPYFALAISIIVGVGGQLSLKAGATQPTTTKIFYFQPFIFVGLASYFIAAVFYIYSLRKIPLSVAFPSVSISYVVVAFLAHLLWGEPFGLRQLLALGLISSGIYILARSS